MNKEGLTEKRNKAIESLNDVKAVLGLDEHYIAILEEKISVLLSCKNCPENKGGLLCQKEYENKCLAQKIQFIKELQEENAEQKEIIDNNVDKKIYVQLANKAELADVYKDQLTKAKKLLKWFMCYLREGSPNLVPYKHKVTEAEQFLKDSEVEK